MPIVDQFKEIMQIHRQSQSQSQFLLTCLFLVSYLRFCLDALCNCNTYEERDSSITCEGSCRCISDSRTASVRVLNTVLCTLHKIFEEQSRKINK